MQKRLFWWELAGFLFTCTMGTLLHFTYRIFGGTAAAALSAVNESTWEHMKLLFVPMFFFSVVQLGAMGKNYPNFLAVRAASVLVGLVLIPVLFYTYTGIVGFSVLWADVLAFYLAALAAFALDYVLLRQCALAKGWQQIAALILLWVLAFLFVWCTFRTPHVALWKDPVGGGFGVESLV